MARALLFFFLGLFVCCREPNKEDPFLLIPLLLSTPTAGNATVSCPGNAILSDFLLADRIESSPGSNPNLLYGDPKLAINGICGQGEFQGSVDVYSLDPPDRNSIVLSWSNKRVLNENGIDFIVFENAFRYQNKDSYFIEPLIVEVGLDKSEFCGWDVKFLGPNNSVGELERRANWQGIAGKNPVFWNLVSRPTKQESIFSSFDVWNSSLEAGGDGFDLSFLSQTSCTSALRTQIQTQGFRFLKLTSGIALKDSLNIPIPTGNFGGGPDIDGVVARSVTD